MLIVLPWGHDQEVYDRPWMTITAVVLCVLTYVGFLPSESAASREIDAAYTDFGRVVLEYPHARLHVEVHGMPGALDGTLARVTDLTARPAPGDAQLETATRRLVAALNAYPAYRLGWIPARPAAARVVTHMFAHGGLLHLAGNMLFLWVAGGLLECFWRRWAFLALYFVAGLGGLVAHHVSSPTSTIPLVGASGAIAGLLGAMLVGYPTARIRLAYFFFVFIRPFWGTRFVPAWAALAGWFAFELLQAALASSANPVAHWAHVGGFATGVVLALLARQHHLVAIDAGVERAPKGLRATAAVPAATPAISSPPPGRSPSKKPPIEAIELRDLGRPDDFEDFGR